MTMVGNRIAAPPAFSIAAASAPASSRGRVTTMPRPASGLFFTDGGKDRRGALGAQGLGGAAAERFRIVAGAFDAHNALAVGRGDQRAEPDLSICKFCIGPERKSTAAAESEADRALGAHAGSARLVGERGHPRHHPGTAGHALEAEAA